MGIGHYRLMRILDARDTTSETAQGFNSLSFDQQTAVLGEDAENLAKEGKFKILEKLRQAVMGYYFQPKKGCSSDPHILGYPYESFDAPTQLDVSIYLGPGLEGKVELGEVTHPEWGGTLQQARFMSCNGRIIVYGPRSPSKKYALESLRWAVREIIDTINRSYNNSKDISEATPALE